MANGIFGQSWTTIFAVLFGISEAIGMIPGIQASGVFQAIFNTLKWLKGAVTPTPPQS